MIADNEIDAIFVSELKGGFLFASSSTDKGRDPNLVKTLSKQSDGAGNQALTHMGVLQILQRKMDVFGQETGHGNLKFTILQFGEEGKAEAKGTVVLYIYHLQEMPIVIGFVNTRQEGDSLGNMLFFCQQNINSVRESVEDKFGKK